MKRLASLFILVFSMGIGAYGQTTAQTDTTQTTAPDTITIVFEQAMFYGGMNAMAEFLGHTVRYPAAARKGRAEGTVRVSMRIDEEGNLHDIKIKEGVHPALDAEALRVVSLMPRWLPATENGKPVSSDFVLPIKFKLAD